MSTLSQSAKGKSKALVKSPFPMNSKEEGLMRTTKEILSKYETEEDELDKMVSKKLIVAPQPQPEVTKRDTRKESDDYE
jgi:hypothetical protein